MPKSAVAIAGGVLMIMIGVIDQHLAFEHIDLNVIFLLVGMMVLAGLISETGAFQYLAIVAAQRTRGNGFPPGGGAVAHHRGALGVFWITSRP